MLSQRAVFNFNSLLGCSLRNFLCLPCFVFRFVFSSLHPYSSEFSATSRIILQFIYTFLLTSLFTYTYAPTFFDVSLYYSFVHYCIYAIVSDF